MGCCAPSAPASAYIIPSNSDTCASVAFPANDVAGAYHQSVVTPTGNVYVACTKKRKKKRRRQADSQLWGSLGVGGTSEAAR